MGRWSWLHAGGSHAEEDARGDAAATIPEGAVRRRILFTGTVQGVGFRFTCEGYAEQHHLTGWVRNLDDGDVLCEAQGAPDDVAALVRDLVDPKDHSWFSAKVAKVEELEPVPEREFRVRL